MARGSLPYPPDRFWEQVRMVLAEGQGSRREPAKLSRIVRGFSVPGRQGRYLGDPAALRAYVRAFLPYELPKVPLLIEQAHPIPSPLLETGELTVADCGAGPGSAALGLLCYLAHGKETARRRVTFTLCEQEKTARRLAKLLVGRLAAEFDLTVTIRTTRRLLPERPVDLLLMQNLLSEACTTTDEAVTLLVQAIDVARSLLVVEPADRRRSRLLHAARDRLMRARRVVPLAPCTHGKPCPALVDRNDWCSYAHPFTPPRAARMGLREGRLPRRRLKCSYLIAERGVGHVPGSWLRAVTGVRRLSGSYEVHLCGDEGKRRYRLLKRRLAEHNGSFRKIRTGDLVMIDPAPETARGFRDLGRECDVRVVRAGSAQTFSSPECK